MSTLTGQRPPTAERPVRPAPDPPADDARARVAPEYGMLAAVIALLLSACLSLARVFVGLDFLVPVIAAALAPLGTAWACRRLRLGPGLTLTCSLAGWALFVSLVFLSETLALGLVPTLETARGAFELWLRGLVLIQTQPSPTFAEAGLLFLAVTGVWAVAHAVDALVFRLQAPITAIVLAMVLWTVPLALARPAPSAWRWAVPFLAAAAGLLLTSADSDLGRYGRWLRPGDPAGVRRRRNPLLTGGAMLAVCAIAAGSLLAPSLPGYGKGPWYYLSNVGGTTLTTNPIVSLQQNLVSQDTGPVLRVRSSRPVYVRTTSLDLYSEREEWTAGDVIRGQPVSGPVPASQPLTIAEQVPVEVEVIKLPNAILVPLPYQTTIVRRSTVNTLRYDGSLATFTVDKDRGLEPGDRFEVVAALPDPSAEVLDAVTASAMRTDPALTALPEGVVPEQVGELARQIVNQAGATTPFQQALAVQNELRTWTYSLEVIPSHSGNALVTFLENRTGYCEQFAATMAVMLRELDIPARVAVGFTPGIPDDLGAAERGEETTYTVSLANAHAWVEVLFPGYGWIAFEPTPRSDGNVLVPTASNLAPSTVLQQAAPETADLAPGMSDFLNQGDERPGDLSQIPNPERDGAGTAPGSIGEDWPGLGLLLAVVAGLAGGGAAVPVLASRRGRRPRSPVERVLLARGRIRRLGSGLSLPAKPSETDQEYLERLVSGKVSASSRDRRERVESAAVLLSRRAGQAQWAPSLPEGAVEVAEAAARVLEDELLHGLPAWRRALVHGRASLSTRSR